MEDIDIEDMDQDVEVFSKRFVIELLYSEKDLRVKRLFWISYIKNKRKDIIIISCK